MSVCDHQEGNNCEICAPVLVGLSGEEQIRVLTRALEAIQNGKSLTPHSLSIEERNTQALESIAVSLEKIAVSLIEVGPENRISIEEREMGLRRANAALCGDTRPQSAVTGLIAGDREQLVRVVRDAWEEHGVVVTGPISVATIAIEALDRWQKWQRQKATETSRGKVNRETYRRADGMING